MGLEVGLGLVGGGFRVWPIRIGLVVGLGTG